jgi:uncharacterized membrane protein
MKEFYLYLLTVPVFFAIDILWITVVAKKLYFRLIPNILPQPRWLPAIIFYLLYIVGILFFAVLPNLDKGPLRIFAVGAFLGLLAYSTYDLSNLSTLADWPLTITIIDIIWGTFLTGTVSVISYYLAKSVLHF